MSVQLLSVLLVAVLAIAVSARSTPAFTHLSDFKPSNVVKTHHWALLIAGSNTYGNYRHQADICHAYQILHASGIADEHIVVMHFDDIANDPENPHQGVIINDPSGKNVYVNVPKDYTGADVTAANFLAVLAGDKSKLSGNGSGKVIASGPNDNVFVFFSDHGGPGILGIPTGPYLYANDLISTLTTKAANKQFAQLTLYIEACESGSMVEGLLPDNINIYVTTASNADESSWGFYCPGMVPPPPSEYTTCLGDLYSISFMQQTEQNNPKTTTLNTQYQMVRDRTSMNGTYNQGSHVMQYGQLSIATEFVADFIGVAHQSSSSSSIVMNQVQEIEDEEDVSSVGVKQADADLLHLWTSYQRADDDSKAAKWSRLNAEVTRRQLVEQAVRTAVQGVIGAMGIDSEDVDAIMTAAPPAGEAITTEWACYKQAMEAFAESCGQMPQGAMKHARGLVNLCNAGFTAEQAKEQFQKVCPAIGLTA